MFQFHSPFPFRFMKFSTHRDYHSSLPTKYGLNLRVNLIGILRQHLICAARNTKKSHTLKFLDGFIESSAGCFSMLCREVEQRWFGFQQDEMLKIDIMLSNFFFLQFKMKYNYNKSVNNMMYSCPGITEDSTFIYNHIKTRRILVARRYFKVNW